ncbi:hypothetical protein EXU85_16175 [Spirosoma sp. KCTC 42546]|uniref:hypothetical protein n=1 Tax=Spirosoma sp. KCTC 42546 TaxID=2520506 RepID=UPI00115BF0E9|nr:hypothetical protein [Spirosoma sp. KCTC 42546]QDK80061.1 hypothetical protein EXU85_16175 [Spirosoma sp. KCTC 42546]
MKNSILSLLLLVALGIISCKKTAEVDPTAYPLKEYTLDLNQAKAWLPGKWKLIKVSAQILNPTIPNVELVIDENQINLIQDGIQTDKVDYTTVKTDYGLLIKTNAQPRGDNWYIRDPSLYINKDRMYLDLGRAQDLPAYEFSKVN